MFTMISIFILILLAVLCSLNESLKYIFKPFLFIALLAFVTLNFKYDLVFGIIYVVVYSQLLLKLRVEKLTEYIGMSILTLVPLLLGPTFEYFQLLFLLYTAKVLELYAVNKIYKDDSRFRSIVSFGFLFLIFFFSIFQSGYAGQILSLLIYLALVYEFLFYPPSVLELLNTEKSRFSFGLFLFTSGFIKPFAFFGILSSLNSNSFSLSVALVIISILTIALFTKKILESENYVKHQGLSLVFGLNVLFTVVFVGNSLESISHYAYIALAINLLFYKHLIGKIASDEQFRLNLLVFYPTPLSPLFYLFIFCISLYYAYGSLLNLFLMLITVFIPMSFYFIIKRNLNDTV